MPAPKRSIRFLLNPFRPLRRLTEFARQAHFDRALLAGEIAIVVWLSFACAAFAAITTPWWPDALWLSLAATATSWRLGLHRDPAGRPWLPQLGRSLLVAPILGAVIFAGAAWQALPVSPAAAFWFGSAVASLFLGLRLCVWAARATWPGAALEMLRWLVMAAAGTALLLPFYGRHGFGSGDVYWYVAMLADVVAQIHHGVFPVWVGQSEYAFNGAMSPLRLAPLFQYAGAACDLLTLHTLEPTALANLVICVFGLMTAASAYLAVRLALPRHPALAGVLAGLWLVCPGVLAPLYAGFQYMEWIAMPFPPLLLYGCWRLWTRDDRAARLAIVAALAGMMLAHTPTALWGGLLAAGMYLAHLVARRNWSAESGRIAAMAAGFALLGGFPVGSVLAIDNRASLTAAGSQPWAGFGDLFPGNFRPIDLNDMGLKAYQLGYTLMAAGIISLVLLAWLRPRGAIAFALAVLVILPLTVPVPGLTNFLWSHAPSVVMTITNCPPQRLFEFWAIIIVFAVVLAVGAVPPGPRSRWPSLLLLGLCVGGIWSAMQAEKMVSALKATFVDPEAVAVSLRPENLQLARFAYATFSNAPGYASHGHVDPGLENRLLDGPSLKLLAANADAAAPKVRPESDPATLPRLAQTGVWTATSENHKPIYSLTPPLRLESGQHYALRLEFLHPEKTGVLQVISHDMFREYMLPDSGLGLSSSSLAFGALPTSSPVAALEQGSPGPVKPDAFFVAQAFSGENFDFARFWLFTYDVADLPIRVSSWIPYRAQTETAIPAFLETPRIWQRAWRATVNGKPAVTRESPQHLVMVPLEPGTSEVVLTFHPPLWLATWFWLCLGGWAVLLAGAAQRLARRARLT
jgi:hypothetical protein